MDAHDSSGASLPNVRAGATDEQVEIHTSAGDFVIGTTEAAQLVASLCHCERIRGPAVEMVRDAALLAVGYDLLDVEEALRAVLGRVSPYTTKAAQHYAEHGGGTAGTAGPPP